MVRDQERDKMLKCIWQQYQKSEEGGPQTPSCGRGYVRRADCYFAQRFLRKQPERRLGECPAGVRDHRSQSREPSHRGWPTQPSSDRPQGLYAYRGMPEKARRGHPLGRGHPERVGHRSYVTPSTLHERISLIRHQIPIARQRTGMTSLPLTPRHLDTPWWPTGSAAENATTVEPTNASIMNDAWDTARLNG